MNKTKLLFPLLLLAVLPSCSITIDKIDPVPIEYGTLIGMDEKIGDYSHLERIDSTELEAKISAKQNFILLAHASSRLTCTCFSEWHDEVLAPYIKKHSLLVYLIDMGELTGEGKDSHGLKLNADYATLGIFKDGELAYQHDTSSDSDPWVNDLNEFAAWMNQRIKYPALLFIDREQLEEKYSQAKEFTIFFTRSTCPDCSYLSNNYLKEYLANTEHVETFYAIDGDVEGLRYVKGEDGILYSPKQDGNAYQQKAYENWSSFKTEYGLTYSDENEAGWEGGFVPTLYHINPDASLSGRKTGDVIDGAAVLYNDSIKDDAISSTYFTAERLELESLSYLKGNKSIKEEDKILTGKKVKEKGERSNSAWVHEETSVYHDPICKAFLDTFVGN